MLKFLRTRLEAVNQLNKAPCARRPLPYQPCVQRCIAEARVTRKLLLRDTTLSHNSANKPAHFFRFGAFDCRTPKSPITVDGYNPLY